MKAVALALLCLPLAACQLFFGGDDDGGISVPDADPLAPDAAPRPDAHPFPDGGLCNPVVTQFPIQPSPHVMVGSTVAYTSNPPTSGPHYPVWARWGGTYGPGVLARSYYVHNLEHGGVVFLVNCPQAGGCPALVAQLQTLQTSLAPDPKCMATPTTPTRTLIVDDAMLPAGVQVGAAAWGFSYTATCFDETSLRSFYDDHFGHATEDTCANGSVP